MTNAKSKPKSKPKSKRGGARPGAGRKPKLPECIAPVLPTTTENISARVLAQIGEEESWLALLEATKPSAVATYSTSRSDGIVTPISTKEQASLLNIFANSLKFHREQVSGKAPQAVEVGGKNGGPIQSAIEVTFVTSNAGQS